MQIEVNITGLTPLAVAITHLAEAWMKHDAKPAVVHTIKNYQPEPPKAEPVKATRKRKAKPEAVKVDSATVAADKAAEKTAGHLGTPKADKPEPAKAEAVQGEVMPKELTRAEVSTLTMETAKIGPEFAKRVVDILATFGAKNAKGVSDETLQEYAAKVQEVADSE